MNIISRQEKPVNGKEIKLTIDDLKNVRRQKLRVESLQERIEQLRSRAEYTQRELGECGRSDPTRDRLAEYVADIDALERELTAVVISIEKQIVAIDVELEKLPANKVKILRLRFFDGLRWRDVARRTNYSESYCKAIAKSVS